jgi:glycerophosphoryl diester phosphodiesterase
MAQPRLMKRAKRRGQAVLCYTVNEPKEIHRLKSLGVWGIITDNPPLAIKTREEAI